SRMIPQFVDFILSLFIALFSHLIAPFISDHVFGGYSKKPLLSLNHGFEMFHGWDPGSSGFFWNCKELYLNEQIGRLWKQNGLLVIRRKGDLGILFGFDLVLSKIGIAEIRLRREKSKAFVNIKARSFLLILGFSFCFLVLRYLVTGYRKFGIWGLMRFDIQESRNLRINGVRGSINREDLLIDFLYDLCYYIKDCVQSFSSTNLQISFFLLRISFLVVFSLVSMSQGQLVGKGGASKEGEGVRKRLKISVPHFDNSDLIKSYAMTLIGRCMNPVAQKLCSSLCHDEDHCPLNPKSVDKKTDSREELANKKEDRARSYKGVVIHGEESQQERGTDQRNYYGKGKGKMHEDQDSKWVRVPERGNKRYSSYHDNNRNDEGNNRHRNTRWEQPRSYVQESREKGHRGTRRERSPPHYAREEPKEEGELQDTGSANKGSQMEGKTSASNNLQIESNGARANLIKLPPKSVAMENGAIAAIVSGTVGAGKGTEPPLGDNGKDMEENEVMDLAENVFPSAGDNGCMGEDEAFENLTDGEMEELNGSQEVVLETVEEESRPTDVEEKELQVGEEEKKKGARKILKHTMAAGASKKKFVQALLSQNKNTQARQGKRQGDGSKLQEDKGSSYPKQTSSKNSTASHGQMALVTWLCVGMHLAHFIQWMLDLISVKQVQWKNDTRRVLDKVLGSGFIIWDRDLKWSLIMGGGGRGRVMDTSWIIAGEHTLGLVSLNQVQRTFGSMIGIKLAFSVPLQDGSGYDKYTVSNSWRLFKTCSKYARLLSFGVIIWDIICS
ncbi:hypothetical protein IGI04_014036, partial [Brassica rapa subsp. trilocularis]